MFDDFEYEKGNGYNWCCGKSVNALYAEEEGKFTASALAKKLSVSSKAIKKVLEPCEWHHTSRFFNETDYYSYEDAINNIDEIKKVDKELKKQNKKTNIFYNCDVAYDVWREKGSGRYKRRYPETIQHKKVKIEIKGSKVLIYTKNEIIEKRLSNSSLIMICNSTRGIEDECIDVIYENFNLHATRGSGYYFFFGSKFNYSFYLPSSDFRVLITAEAILKLVNKTPELKEIFQKIKEQQKVYSIFMKFKENYLLKTFKEMIGRKQKIKVADFFTELHYQDDKKWDDIESFFTVDRKELIKEFEEMQLKYKEKRIAQFLDGKEWVRIGLKYALKLPNR